MSDEQVSGGMWSGAMRVYAAGGAAGAVAVAVSPPAVRGVIFAVAPLALLIAFEAGVRLHRPGRTTFWRFVQLAFLALIGGGMLGALEAAGSGIPAGTSDAVNLVGIALLVIALLVLLRERNRGVGPIGLIDAAIFTGGLGLIVWTSVVHHIVDDILRAEGVEFRQKVFLAAYPVVDLLLFGMVVALAGDSGRRPRAFWLMISAVGFQLVADLWNLSTGGSGSAMRGHVPVLWFLAFAAFGASALHPSMSELSKPQSRAWRSSPLHLAGLGASAIAAPAVLAVAQLTDGDEHIPIVIAVGAAVPILLLWRTILERGRAEGALREVYQRTEEVRALRQLAEVKEQILTAVSHEVRTPLTAVSGFALTLDHRYDDLSAEQRRDMTRRIVAQSQRLTTALSKLLDAAGARSGAAQDGLADVRAIVHSVLDTAPEPRHKDFHVDLAAASAAADPDAVERMVRNLVDNAVKHTDPGTPVWIRTRPEDELVLIAVEDAGPGVPPDLRDTIFGEFVRGGNVPAHSPGLGLGLAVVRGLAEANGGRAWVEDRDGGGASFRIALPQASEHRPAARSAT